ncbi:xylose isomerase [Bacillus sp. AFS040349]|nr:xylose isomerase [Bacillus sp. AFS040349]
MYDLYTPFNIFNRGKKGRYVEYQLKTTRRSFIMSHLSLTTWSLHRELGPLRWTYWDDIEKTQKTRIEQQPENTKLVGLPSILEKQGFKSLEVCHFHFKNTENEYLVELRNAFKKSGITFHCLLLDYGDISSPDDERRKSDIKFIKKWIDIAEKVEAKSIRVIGGEANPSDTAALERSMDSFQQLIDYAEPKGVRVVTENFKSLTSTKENCEKLISSFNKKLGLTVDFGNFEQGVKFDSIQALVPFAESIHAKANYDHNGLIDKEEFEKSLQILANCDYNGPITLVYDGPGNLWDGINEVKMIAEKYCD